MFIEFENIWVLVVGLLVVAGFLGVYFYISKKKKYNTKKIATNSVLLKVAKKKSKKDKIISSLLLLSIFLLFVALSNPMMRLSNSKEGVNVVLTVDNSGSMSATDFAPNRIEAAKIGAKTLVEQLELKDNVGVVSFSDATRIVSFLTNDKDRVLDKIDNLNAQGGTAIGDGLAMSVDMVTSIPNKKKLVILLSDGEQTAGQISIADAIEFAKSEEVIVYTVGVGSSEPVALGRDWFGNVQYAKLDEASLKQIAQETGGQYFRAEDSIKLKEIYEELPEQIKKEKELQSIKDEILWLVLFLMISSFFVKYHKRVVVW